MEKDITDKAYAAGFVDGEGCIAVVRSYSRNGEYTFRVYVTVANTNRDIIDWFLLNFGGGIYTKRSNNKNYKIVYQWRMATKKAVEFLKLIQPYLKVKKEQAKLAIEFDESCINFQGKAMRYDEVVRRNKFYLASRELNKKGATDIVQ